jgi:hypothetical protein
VIFIAIDYRHLTGGTFGSLMVLFGIIDVIPLETTSLPTVKHASNYHNHNYSRYAFYGLEYSSRFQPNASVTW